MVLPPVYTTENDFSKQDRLLRWRLCPYTIAVPVCYCQQTIALRRFRRGRIPLHLSRNHLNFKQKEITIRKMIVFLVFSVHMPKNECELHTAAQCVRLRSQVKRKNAPLLRDLQLSLEMGEMWCGRKGNLLERRRVDIVANC